jgi:SWIM zinc finger
MSAPTDLRAVRLAKTGNSWLRVRSKLTGRPLALGIPSLSRPGLFHMVNTNRCDCKGFEFGNDCVHIRALRIYVAECKAKKGAAA